MRVEDVILGIAVAALLITTWEQWKNQRELKRLMGQVNDLLAKARQS